MQLTKPLLVLGAIVELSLALPVASFESHVLLRRAPAGSFDSIKGVFDRFRGGRQPALETQMSSTPAFRAEQTAAHSHVGTGAETTNHQADGAITFAHQTNLNDELAPRDSYWSRFMGRTTRPRPETITLGSRVEPLNRDPVPYDQHFDAVHKAYKKGMIHGSLVVDGSVIGSGVLVYAMGELGKLSDKRHGRSTHGQPDKVQIDVGSNP